MEIIAILILGTLWAYREWTHTYQINMLTDKLMSRNFEEYKELTSEPKQHDPVDMTDEEEWAREQKERLEQ